MKFVYIGKGMEVTDSLKARVEKKLTKLERYFQGRRRGADPHLAGARQPQYR